MTYLMYVFLIFEIQFTKKVWIIYNGFTITKKVYEVITLFNSYDPYIKYLPSGKRNLKSGALSWYPYIARDNKKIITS